MVKEKKGFGFGIVGTGMIAHFHARAIAAIEHASLLGVYSTTKEKRDAFARDHKCTGYDTLEQMLANDEIDIVCICTPSGAHLEPAVKSLEAGKHCLIEKPLEITLERCDEIIRAAARAGVLAGVIFPSRFSTVNKHLHEALSGKRFGDLVLGSAYVKWHRTPEYYLSGKWRGTWKYDGGGALMNQGIHSVDLLQWCMGPVASISAFTTNVRHKNIEVEDTVAASLQFVNGALGTIECSTAVFPGSLKRLEILGTKGTAIAEEDHLLQWTFMDEMPADEQIRQLAQKSSSGGGAADPASIGFSGHQKQIENMIAAIRGQEKLLVDATEGRKAVEIVLAIYESAATGQRIHMTARNTFD